MTERVLKEWHPENQTFWQTNGQSVAKRNLWLSIPALTLAFAVWMVWSVVVVNLPNVGFKFTTDELFWLTALPALCGATLKDGAAGRQGEDPRHRYVLRTPYRGGRPRRARTLGGRPHHGRTQNLDRHPRGADHPL